jgi:hypothetical protein
MTQTIQACSSPAASAFIPYEAVFISDEPVTIEDVERVKELATRYGWKM